ncbi:MAG: hypothetical protein GY750_04465 [Lentisphaerae bacterium]|nr:hypothetical protein [Lentisphaerota bacterium]MCP4100664.1 hypothetical protein [Lentisphaerota bacterium]
MKYPSICPKCNTQFPEDFWKMADTASQNNLFYCPSCNSVLNPLYPGFQNFFITSQFMSMTLTPCNDSFSLQTNDKVELQNHFVTNLHMHFFMYGFEGEVELTIPVRFYVTRLFDFLTARNPIQVEFTYNQVKLGEESTTVEIQKLVGFIVSEGNESIKQEFEGLDMQVEPTNPKNAVLAAYRYTIKLKFVDPLKYFLSKYKPFALYQNKSYENVLKQHLGDISATEFVKVSVDSEFSELTSTRIFICMPFQDHFGPQNLYNFWLATIKGYNGNLVMNEDGSYTIIKQRKATKSQSDDIDKFDKPFIKKVAIRQHDRYNTQLEMFNAVYTGGGSEQVKTNNTQQSQGVFKKSHKLVQNFQSTFDDQSKFEQARFQNYYSLQYLFEVEFNGLPYKTKLWPGNEVQIKAANWLNLFGTKDLQTTIVEMELDFQLMADETPPIDYREKKDLSDDKLKTVMARFQSKTEQALRPFTAVTCRLVCENNDSTYLYFPEVEKIDYPVKIQGTITVPDDVTSKYNNKVPYLIFDGSSDNPATQNTNKEDSSSSGYTMASMPQHYLAYHVKLPVFSATGGEPIVPVMYLPNLVNDQFFYPFQNEQAVEIWMFQEYALLHTLASYTSDKNIDKSKQVNSCLLGPEQQGEFRFEVNSSDEILSITKKELKTNTQKTLTMQNDTLLLSFEDMSDE